MISIVGGVVAVLSGVVLYYSIDKLKKNITHCIARKYNFNN